MVRLRILFKKFNGFDFWPKNMGQGHYNLLSKGSLCVKYKIDLANRVNMVQTKILHIGLLEQTKVQI